MSRGIETPGERTIRWIAALAILALIVTASWGYDQQRVRVLLTNQLEGERQRAFYGLLENVERLELSLSKALAATSPPQVLIHLADTWRYADAAVINLAGIPMAHTTSLRTGTYLNQAGDYARSMVRIVSDGRVLTQAEIEQIEDLHSQVVDLNRALHELESSLVDAGHRWSALQAMRPVSYDAIDADDGVRGLKSIEEHLQQYPTLIYDGPFSDHVFDIRPKGLVGPEISEEEAAERVMDIMQTLGDGRSSAEKVSEAKGPIPAYTFTSTVDGRQYWLDVSRKGGHLVWLNTDASGSAQNIDLEAAREIALEFLHDLGHDDLTPVFTHQEGHRAVTNFVHEQDGVLVYPDQVKVLVCLDEGAILGVDASSYLIAHEERQLPEPRLTQEEALRRLSPELTPGEAVLALIPRDCLEEVLCWEIRARTGDVEFMVYINALTGEEEQIFQLIPVEGGQLPG